MARGIKGEAADRCHDPTERNWIASSLSKFPHADVSIYKPNTELIANDSPWPKYTRPSFTLLGLRNSDASKKEEGTHPLRGDSRRTRRRSRERPKKRKGLDKEEVGLRSLLRSNMLSPHEVLLLSLLRSYPSISARKKPFSKVGLCVPPGPTTSHSIDVLIVVNDSEESFIRWKHEAHEGNADNTKFAICFVSSLRPVDYDHRRRVAPQANGKVKEYFSRWNCLLSLLGTYQFYPQVDFHCWFNS